MSDIPELKSASEIKAALDGTGDNPELAESSDPRDSKSYSFKFSYKDSRGKVWAGKFTNRILTIKERRHQKIMKAQLSGGVPVASLDSSVWEINEMLSHLAFSLDTAADDFPKWAEDLENLYDEGIISELYQEVASHEARFHRREAATDEGA